MFCLGEATLETMQCFLIDQSECLFDAISELDQLPDLPEFEPFRNSYLQEQETQMQDSSLINDIDQFLSASKFSPHSPCRAETLKFLRKQVIKFFRVEISLVFCKLSFINYFFCGSCLYQE